MASLTHHHNKKTGVSYMYLVKSYWDKAKKRPANKQVCLGRVDKETGEVIPSKRIAGTAKRAASAPEVTAKALVAGPYLLLEKLTEQTGLDAMLKKCFPEIHTAMLSIVFFIVQKGLALSHCEQWSAGHLHPHGDIMLGQWIRDLLPHITEDGRQQFLSLWFSKLPEKDYRGYDITPVSSYAGNNEYVKYGYSRDKEALPQINLAMLFGQSSQLPAYYQRMPGNITDVVAMKTTMQSLDFLGSAVIHFVLDSGFYSEDNVDELFRRKRKFTIAVPAGRKWAEKIFEQYYESIQSPSNYLQIDDGESLYALAVPHQWGRAGKRAYLHIYFNTRQAAEESDRFDGELSKYKEELEGGRRVREHEEYYQRYFILKETPKRGLMISFNDEAILISRKRYAGLFCILSNEIKAPATALLAYRARDVVETSFDDLKNLLDMKRLLIHSSAAMDARLFLQFLALIYISQIRNVLQDDIMLRSLTVREVMEAMETLVQISYSRGYGQLYTETNPFQRKIMDAFGVSIQT